jgi:hypothetical protein
MRLTDTALQLIINNIYTIWKTNWSRIISLLNLNVSKVFSNILYIHLIHNLWKRHMPEEITNWVINFLKNRKTEICFSNFMLKSHQIFISILQGLYISLILYLFYNANLLNICKNIILYINFLNFIDDINIIIFSINAE